MIQDRTGNIITKNYAYESQFGFKDNVTFQVLNTFVSKI